MSDRSVVHAKFVIERKFPQSPERVFNAFANPIAKARKHMKLHPGAVAMAGKARIRSEIA